MDSAPFPRCFGVFLACRRNSAPVLLRSPYFRQSYAAVLRRLGGVGAVSIPLHRPAVHVCGGVCVNSAENGRDLVEIRRVQRTRGVATPEGVDKVSLFHSAVRVRVGGRGVCVCCMCTQTEAVITVAKKDLG